ADQAEELARQHNADIQAVAEQTIRQYGYDYPVEVQVGAYHFPDKTYGKMLFPAGEYDAVRVLIGEAKGKNWWCVLFPPLCLISSSEKGMALDQADLLSDSESCKNKRCREKGGAGSAEQSKKARITFKCLELLPEGIRLGHQ
ncbi:MAG TPA: stage II sporulation protein R, partial [Syntrophomonadaceae bacterium]|nr:stage II sporulation protein R [Syntrophomonadaceae bacterium]